MIRAKNTKSFGVAPKVPQFHKRRKPIEGEDLQSLKNVMREIDGQHVSVEDFILLIAPHTGDKGAALTKVMADDLNAFRRLCNEAYDTMTKDTNEVMATTQIELGQLYAERTRLLTVSIIKLMKTIHDYIPNFNLEEYNLDADKYLANFFHTVDLPDEGEVEAAKRQLAYHRLNWLRSEGDRLSAENTKLQQRLSELKKVQQSEIAEQIQKEQEAEAQRLALEKQQAEMQIQLETLVEELDETILNKEEKTTKDRKDETLKTISKKKAAATRKDPTKTKIITKPKDSNWSIKAAQQIERNKIQDVASSKASSTTIQSIQHSTSSIKSTASSRSKLKPEITSRYSKFFRKKMVSSTPATQSEQSAIPSVPSAPSDPSAPSALPAPCAAPAAPSKKGKAGPGTRKKGAKKPVPITQRPQWQDVVEDIPRDVDETPMEIFTSGRGAPEQPCPPTCSPQRGREMQPPPPPSSYRQPPPPPSYRQSPPPQPPPSYRQPSPPRQIGRRAAGPRDTWSGFG